MQNNANVKDEENKKFFKAILDSVTENLTISNQRFQKDHKVSVN